MGYSLDVECVYRRNYTRLSAFFYKNTCAIGNYVYVHNPEDYTDFRETQEKLDSDEMARRWEKMVNDTADLEW